MSLIQLVFALTGLAAEAAILVVMIKRKLRSTFPIFFGYMAYSIVMLGAMFLVVRLPFQAYFYSYYTLTAISLLLGFGILYEVFVNIVKPYSAVIDLGKMLFCWATIFLFLAGLLTTFATTGNITNGVTAGVTVMQRSIQLMQCGLLLLLLLFERRLGLSWRSHSMSIALGLGTYSALNLIVCHLADRVSPVAQGRLTMLSSIASITILGFWCVSLLLPEPQRKTAQDSPTRIILQRWNEALAATPLSAGSRDFAFAPVDSFIPGVEKAVDRVLARKMTS
jgi:hypothetical protein